MIRSSLQETPAPRSAPPIDRLVGWLAARIFNDREFDHGVAVFGLGAWLALFAHQLERFGWWAEVFRLLPAPLCAAGLLVTGGARLVLALVPGASCKQRGVAALASCFFLAFLAFLLALAGSRMTVTPLVSWFAYSAGKSHLRLMVEDRRRARHHLNP